jgi:hypothetical protein
VPVDYDRVLATIDGALDDDHTSPDAMRWTPAPADPTPLTAVRTRADGYATYHLEIDITAFQAAIGRLIDQLTAFGQTAALAGSTMKPLVPDPPHEQWQRALQARRERNTGPAHPRRLDGLPTSRHVHGPNPPKPRRTSRSRAE